MRILIVEDDRSLATTLQNRLNRSGYLVDRVSSNAEAEAAVLTVDYELLLLDRRLPDGDALGRIPTLRGLRPALRIVMLTALDDLRDRIEGLDAGADDYLTKPFDVDELLARIRAALRRPGGGAQPAVVCGNLRFEPGHRSFLVDDRPLVLVRRQALILEALMMRSRRVVQRHTLLDHVYGHDDDVQSNTLDAQVSRLRTRLAAAGATVRVHPVRGVGYLLDDRAPA